MILGAAFFLPRRCAGIVGPDGVAGLSPLAAAAAAALCAGGIYFAGALAVESSFGAGASSTGACGCFSPKTYKPRHEKTCLWEFPTRSDSNWPAQLEKLA